MTPYTTETRLFVLIIHVSVAGSLQSIEKGGSRNIAPVNHTNVLTSGNPGTSVRVDIVVVGKYQIVKKY